MSSRSPRAVFLHALAPRLTAVVFALAACGGSAGSRSGVTSDNDGGADLAPSDGSADAPDAGGGDAARDGGGGDSDGASDACVSRSAPATLSKDPVDLILVVDNSGSMVAEVQAVEENLDQDLASVLAAAGVDYRLILISRHRKEWRMANGEAATSICVQAPLSGVAACPTAASSAIVPAPIFADRFFQYNTKVESTTSFESIITGYFTADMEDDPPLTTIGWSEWLRAGAEKVFIEMTDDDEGMTVDGFLQSLTALAPQHFGADAQHPRFVFHSIIGLLQKPTPSDGYGPSEPIEPRLCTAGDDAVTRAGSTYQELSVRTGGLRFPICHVAAYPTIFRQLAADISARRQTRCDFPIPAPPGGGTTDRSALAVDYIKGDGSGAVQLRQIATPGDCRAGTFSVAGDQITLCPAACAAINADPGARVEVLFPCPLP